MDVFLIENERQCTGDRAPAIMNVLRITNWYDKQIASTGQANGSQGLVLGKYPMAFVEEAAAKIRPQPRLGRYSSAHALTTASEMLSNLCCRSFPVMMALLGFLLPLPGVGWMRKDTNGKLGGLVR
jgi:hypothetical protein